MSRSWAWARPSLHRLCHGMMALGLLMPLVLLGGQKAVGQDLSLPFLREICFLKPWDDFRHEYGEPRRENPRVLGSSVRLRFKNPSWHHDARICVFDNICRVVRYRGILLPGKDLRIEFCADRRRRGSVIVLEAFGRALLYDDISSGTINLPFYRPRR